MQVYLCDFEDSFTYNIYAELKLIGLNCSVLTIDDFKKSFSQALERKTAREAFILGPGPGHPREYASLFPLVRECLINRQDIFMMGICLGHQMIAQALDLEVVHCAKPSHGVAETISLGGHGADFLNSFDSITVQRYNSLCVRMNRRSIETLTNHGFNFVDKNKELWMMWRKNCITYQFHPESIGTSFRSSFFTPLKSFLL